MFTLTLMPPAPQNAAAEQAQFRAEMAREQAQVAAEQVRMQAQMARDQAQMVRDAASAAREAARANRQFMEVNPFANHGITRRQEGMFFVAFLVLVVAVGSVLSTFFRAMGKRFERAPRRGEIDAGAAERLQRIEQAVEAMAIEIERISEGQRFTTRLLSGRDSAELPIRR